MSITQEELAKIAKLARLTEFDAKENIEDFANILNLFDELNSVDTNGIEPMISPLDSVDIFRADDPDSYRDNVDNLLSNVPNATSEISDSVKCFVVPKVIE
jgi:aspartyl-tRNA(Asn)/glutamyl-tRNA(Gln) amidotransferase subunit C